MLRFVGGFFLIFSFATFGLGQQSSSQPSVSPAPASPAQPSKPPEVDGAAGPCALELTVRNADGTAAYAATIKVHITYGFGGFHKLDLQAGTDSEGKAKFVGLPSRVKRTPLEFEAFKGEAVGTAEYSPDIQCRAKQDIVLAVPKTTP